MKKLLVSLACAILMFSCVGLPFGNSYKSFAELYPEIAVSIPVSALGDYVEVGAVGTIFFAVNVAEIKHPEFPNYVLFMDLTSDGNLDGEPDLAIVILLDPDDYSLIRAYPSSPESMMTIIQEVMLKYNLKLKNELHKAENLNLPKNWESRLKELNKMEDPNSAEL